MKLVRQIKMCLKETYSRIQVSRRLFDNLPIKKGLKEADGSSQLLFKFTLEYAIRSVQANQIGFILNSSRHTLVYAGDINILGESIHTVKKNTGALVVVSKEISLEIVLRKVSEHVSRPECNTKREHRDR